MCGIMGVLSYNAFNKKMTDLIKKSMEELESRGRDSFGYYAYPINRKFKAVGRVSDYNMLDKDKKKGDFQVDVLNQHIFLGHTRAATTGSKEDNKNNHPFETEDFILAHNGMIYNHEKIMKDFKINSDIQTDSYVIIGLIQKFFGLIEEKTISKKIKKTIERTTNLLQGYYSCWLIHKPSGKVFLFKSKGADLNVSFSKTLNTFFFASESRYYTEFIETVFPKPTGNFNTFFGIDDLKTVDLDNDAGIVEIDLQKRIFKFDETDWSRTYKTDYNTKTFDSCIPPTNIKDFDQTGIEAGVSDIFSPITSNVIRLSSEGHNHDSSTCEIQSEDIENLIDLKLMKSLGLVQHIIENKTRTVGFGIRKDVDSTLASFGFIANNDFVITVPFKDLEKFEIAMKKAYILVYPDDDVTKMLKTDYPDCMDVEEEDVLDVEENEDEILTLEE